MARLNGDPHDTGPPRASTMSRPMIASSAQSAPLTSTSGWSASMRSCGVCSSKITTPSTQASASSTSAPLRLHGDRTIRSLDLSHRTIGVQTDEKRIAKAACVLQVSQVTDMEQIEDAVGEDDRFPRPPKRSTKAIASACVMLREGFSRAAS